MRGGYTEGAVGRREEEATKAKKEVGAVLLEAQRGAQPALGRRRKGEITLGEQSDKGGI